MRIMVTGGGTGGHTSPAVAIIEELHKRDSRLEIQWVGCRNSIEERVCEALAIPFRTVPVAAWPRSGVVRKLWAGLKLSFSCLRAVLYIQKFRPQTVLGVGGYVSVPLTWIAQMRGIPTVLHEQNKQLGMANRVLAKRAQRLLLGFPDTLGDYDRTRALVVGNPVRAGFITPPTREEACATLGLDPSIPVLLVSGGSQGAQTINEAMKELVKHFGEDELQCIWMTGTAEVASAREAVKDLAMRVEVHAFINDMATACAAASLIVCRAGASSTAEIATLGKPSILVPYPFATDDHQMRNAESFEAAGAAILLRDEDCTGERLEKEVRALLDDPGKLKSMGDKALGQVPPSAVETIVEEIFSVVFEPIER